jgi:hypothetical protein
MGLDFESPENKFLTTLGLEAHNIGSYVNGKWKANGPTVTSVNPSTGKVGGHIRAPHHVSKEQSIVMRVLHLLSN